MKTLKKWILTEKMQLISVYKNVFLLSIVIFITLHYRKIEKLMKKINLIFVVLALSFMTSSCFLFRPSHERCPAYGSNDDSKNLMEEKILETELQEI